MSIANLTCDINRIFADGQLYVALSRAMDPQNLRILYKNPARFGWYLSQKLKINREVVDFLSQLKYFAFLICIFKHIKTRNRRTKMQKTTQETINNVVWKACDTFRGTMDGSDYKDYVLTMLFVKYLSDFYKEKLELLRAEYGDKRERIEAKLKKEKFKLDESCTFEYLWHTKRLQI